MTLRKDKKFKHGEAIRNIARPPSTLSNQDKKRIVKDFYDKSFPATSSSELSTTAKANKAKR